jgi:hypothetical protein
MTLQHKFNRDGLLLSVVEDLGIRDARLAGGVYAEELVKQAFDAAYEIWIAPCLPQYVVHDITHSRAVLDLALRIGDFVCSAPKQEQPLNRHERVVLAAACFLHDIGMQYCKYHSGKSSEEIRATHCILGYDLFEEMRAGSVVQLPDLRLVEPSSAILLSDAAEVAFAHADDRLWQSLTSRDNWFKYYNNPANSRDNFIRPVLLAALLRLADELDMDHERVPNARQLLDASLSEESREHWLACHYVQYVQFVPHALDVVGRVEVALRLPRATREQDADIRAFVEGFRIANASSQAQQLRRWLKASGDMERGPEITVELRRQPERDDAVEDLPPGLREQVRQRAAREPHAGGSELVKCLPGLDSSKEQIQNHLRRGVLSGSILQQHVVLETGWHTNRFISCRRLVAKTSFAEPCARGIAAFFAATGEPITDVLAVGTSAIRLGSLVALYLNAHFTYTHIDQRHHTLDELEYRTTPGGHVLIVDDILGMGTAIRSLLDEVLESCDGPSRISYFSLLLLGQQIQVETILGEKASFHYLVGFPDVTYYHPDDRGRCEICESWKGPPPHERELRPEIVSLPEAE